MLRNGSVVPIHTLGKAGSLRSRIKMANEATRACARARTNLPASIRIVAAGSSNCFNITTSIMSGMAGERPLVPVSGSTTASVMAARSSHKGRISGIAAAWLISYALTLLIYLPWLSAPYYSDDFLFYFAPPPPHLYDFFRMPGASAQLYRPAESIILRVIQSHFGFHTLLIHLIAIAAHASLCSMLWLAAMRLNITRFAAVVAVACLLLTQVAPPALLGNDSMSQAMGTALCALSVLIAGAAYQNRVYLDSSGNLRASPNLLDIAGAFAFFAALLFKETGLGLVFPIALLSFLPALRKAGWLSATKIMVARMLPYAGLIVVYLLLRLGARGPLSGGGSYRVGFGFNVPRNLLQEAIALINPVSSVAVFIGVAARSYGVLLVAALASGVVVVALAVGLWRIPADIPKFLVLCAFCALVPAILLEHVSELYAYNAAPYFALLVGLAIATVWRKRKQALAIGLGLAIGCQIWADREKAALMYANGKAAERLLPALQQYIDRMPRGGEIILAQSPVAEPRYSIYLLHGLDVLSIGCWRLGAIFGRPDVGVTLMPVEEAVTLPPDRPRLMLELRNGRLQPLASGS